MNPLSAHLENKVYVRSSTTEGQEMLRQMSEGKPVFYDETKRVDLRGFWEEFFGDWIGRFFHFVYASTLTLLIR